MIDKIIKYSVKDGVWRPTLEYLDEISYSQLGAKTIEFTVRELQDTFEDYELQDIIDRIKTVFTTENEDNMGAIAKNIFDVISEEDIIHIIYEH